MSRKYKKPDYSNNTLLFFFIAAIFIQALPFLAILWLIEMIIGDDDKKIDK